MRPSKRPQLDWPDGKKICATLTVGIRGLHARRALQEGQGLEVNLVSLSHAQLRRQRRDLADSRRAESATTPRTVDVNGLAVQKCRRP